MKKTFLKTMLAILICLAIALTSSVAVLAADADAGDEKPENYVCTNANETLDAIFTSGLNGGAIRITNAVLKSGGQEQDVVLVALHGLTYDKGMTNNFVSCVLAAFNLNNSYLKLVKGDILENVPEGSKVVFIGHSLGGMVLQQLRADEDVTGKYEILATLTAGSPYIMTKKEKQEGTMIRLADKSDGVPYLSPSILFDRKNHNNRIIEDGGYDGDFDKAHNQSYRYNEVWLKYDALGIEGGDTVISFANSDVLVLGSQRSRLSAVC